MNLIEVSIGFMVAVLVSITSVTSWTFDVRLFKESEQQFAIDGCAASIAESILAVGGTSVSSTGCPYTYQVTPTPLGVAVTVLDGSLHQRIEVVEHAEAASVTGTVYGTVAM